MDYNPYSFYHPFWGLPHEYHLPQQYFNPHQNYWSQFYMNEQRMVAPKEFTGFKEKKLEVPLVKIEHME
jgi:hypothetical protein